MIDATAATVCDHIHIILTGVAFPEEWEKISYMINLGWASTFIITHAEGKKFQVSVREMESD